MKKYIIGIDEAGRGPLAGPVAVGAVIMPAGLKPLSKKIRSKLKDSKKLTSKAREEWYEYLKKHPKIKQIVVMISPQTIDRINITEAVNLAAGRALKKLAANGQNVIAKAGIYLDAGIKIKLNSETLVRGDEKINAIKLASIAAKVERDRYMLRLHLKFPEYGFDKHKGYGTKKHFEALKKLGPCPIHRLTFIKKH